MVIVILKHLLLPYECKETNFPSLNITKTSNVSAAKRSMVISVTNLSKKMFRNAKSVNKSRYMATNLRQFCTPKKLYLGLKSSKHPTKFNLVSSMKKRAKKPESFYYEIF